MQLFFILSLDYAAKSSDCLLGPFSSLLIFQSYPHPLRVLSSGSNSAHTHTRAVHSRFWMEGISNFFLHKQFFRPKSIIQYFKITYKLAKIYQIGQFLLNLPIGLKSSLTPLVPQCLSLWDSS